MTKVFSYIRFSTPEQLKGDSLRRQLEDSEQYAKEHGLILDDSLKLQDLGLSAYSGAHRNKGALGIFLQLIESGKIANGSILIVESLDRLSREEVFVALEQFMGIIRNGIKIVTLCDKREYDKRNLNAVDLVVSIMSMCRAHEESAMKAMRLGKAWENKRTLAINGTRKLTKKCPGWLKLNEEKTKYIPISNRVKEIQRIFKMKLSGKGATAIVRELNQTSGWKPGDDKQNDENKGKKREPSWRESYIKKILQDHSVIGEFQPHRLLKGKRREPIGERIIDYYPAIIDSDDFFRVQELIKSNIHKGGKTGKVNNLFTHTAKCGYCGGSMAFIDKGKTSKGRKYLVCDRARRGLDCCRTGMRYDEFELLVLKYCKGLQTKDILTKSNDTAIALLKDQFEGKQGELKSITVEIENIADSVPKTNDERVRILLGKRISERLDKQDSLKLEINNLKKQIDKLSQSFEDTQLTLDSLKELLTYLNTDETNKKVEVRLRLRNEIRKLIDNIIVYPVGSCIPSIEMAEKVLNDMSVIVPKDKDPVGHSFVKDNLQRHIENPKEFRFFIINFKSGSTRTIAPTAKMPLTRDFEKENVYRWHEFETGRIIREKYLKDRIEIKHFRRTIGPNNEEVLQEYFDTYCELFNKLAEKNNQILIPYLNRL